ncbi:Rv2175c family DNA-binding protein [Kineococcus glutinatus]|uniref:Rv2175c family DNA-binding protein n=1 Tax=Kineococcus glutinatus TaxID=1070872 RepID=A0ABP9I0X5_9ACTN
MAVPQRAEIASEQGDAVEELVGEWLTVPDVAKRTGVSARLVRQQLQERQLLALRLGERRVVHVPAAFLAEDGPVPALRGTISVLADSGLSDVEAVRWLFTPDDTLPGRPIDALRSGHKTEIRRRAQALLL